MSKMQRTRSTMRQEQPKQTTNSTVLQKKEQPKKSIKGGKPVRKAGVNKKIEKLKLNGRVEIRNSLDINTPKLVRIKELVNEKPMITTDEGSCVNPIKCNFESDNIFIKQITVKDKTSTNNDTNEEVDTTSYFDFIIGPGTENAGKTKEKPIIFETSCADVKCTWATKATESYYTEATSTSSEATKDWGHFIQVRGQWFDGFNNSDSTTDDDSFTFWKSQDVSDPEFTLDEDRIEQYTKNELAQKNPQYYFERVIGKCIRKDLYRIDGEETEVAILMNYYTNKPNKITAEYYDSNKTLQIYTGEISYPFRGFDNKTVEILIPTRADVFEGDINEQDNYTNSMWFETMKDEENKEIVINETIMYDYELGENPTDQQKKEAIESKNYKVHFNDNTKMKTSIKDTIKPSALQSKETNVIEIRYNDNGVYQKSDNGSSTNYIEMGCDQWIINKPIEKYKDSDVIKEKVQNMVSGTQGEGETKKTYTFTEKEVYIINGEVKGDDGLYTNTHGKIDCIKLQFCGDDTNSIEGCTNVELQEGCTITCDDLII